MTVLGLLPYLALLLVFVTVPGQDGRVRFLYASVLWGMLVLLLTEALSLAGAITPAALRAAWTAICVAGAAVAWRWGRLPQKPHLTRLGWCVCGFVLVPLVAGLLYPPLTWDALTYHLPKVEHWLQNGNVGHYPTPNERQNIFAPLAEYVILQGRALSGGDLFANSVQWLAYAGSVLNVSLIAKLLGADQRTQTLAALLCASIPMAILQASTCQTDLFTAWQLSSMVALGLLWYRQGRASSGVLFGAALGLACFTKGTAYPIALPFVVLYAIYTLRRPRQRLGTAFCAALIALLCNIPFFIKNTVDYGDPLGSKQNFVAGTRISPSWRTTLGNIACNIGVNIELPDIFGGKYLHNHVTNTVNGILTGLDILKENKNILPWAYFPKRSNFSRHEDTVQNTLPIILMIITFSYLLLRGQRIVRIYTLCVICSFIIFSAMIEWQLWITRLQLSIFVLAMPAVSVAFSGRILLQKYIVALCIVIMIFYNVFNKNHQLLAVYSYDIFPYISHSREDQYFLTYSDFNKEKFHQAVDAICTHNNLGLIVGLDSRYYPLFPLLRARGCAPQIFHVMTEADLEKAESIFLFDAECRLGICRPKDQNPFVREAAR